MKSYPFTSKKVTYDEQGLPIYDRAVDSAFLRKVFSNYFSDGVFYKPTNALQVVADTGMQVVVEPGVCHIRGAMGIEESRRTMVVQAAEEMDRIDTVVARLDLSVDVRSVDLYVIKGTAAESPQPPALTRDSTKWEIGLANLFVAKNVSTITQQRITDTRLDNDRCGVVAQTIGDLDTAPYFAQLTAAIAKHQTDAEAQIAALQAAIEAVEGDSAWMMKAFYDPQNKGPELMRHPIGYIFDWAPVEGQDIDLSTPEKVAEHFGYGTWKELNGVFTFARDEAHEVNSTGGEETHALTEQEGPTHTHAGTEHQAGKFATASGFASEYKNASRVNVQGAEAGTGGATWQWASIRWTDTVENSGEGQPHNNMPPYLTVYKWQRIA